MLKHIRKDITIEQVFHTADKMLQHDIAGHFPFIVGFPDESVGKHPGEAWMLPRSCAR